MVQTKCFFHKLAFESCIMTRETIWQWHSSDNGAYKRQNTLDLQRTTREPGGFAPRDSGFPPLWRGGRGGWFSSVPRCSSLPFFKYIPFCLFHVLGQPCFRTKQLSMAATSGVLWLCDTLGTAILLNWYVYLSAEIVILFREYSRGLLLQWGVLHVKKVERLVKLIVSYTCPLTANAQRWPL